MRPGSIPDSNGVALRAMATAAGAIVRVSPPVRDDRAATEHALDEALRGSDVLVTVGGVSVGDRDFVRPALEAIGARIEMYKVAIKPGKPLTIGRRGSALVLGLPGNPASAMVTFALFGVPLLRALQGDAQPVAQPLRAKLASDVKHTPGRMEFLRANLSNKDGELLVRPLSNQASGATTTMAAADALAVIPSEATNLRAGELVDVLLLHDLEA
jgi:molybdopterin molybdotransferase